MKIQAKSNAEKSKIKLKDLRDKKNKSESSTVKKTIPCTSHKKNNQ